MPLLGGLIAGLFTGLFEFLAKYVTNKFAVGAVIVAALLALAATLMNALRAVFTSLGSSLTDGGILNILGTVLPDNTGACIAAYVSTWTACTLYSVSRDAVKAVASG